jgi:hypothetical protein
VKEKRQKKRKGMKNYERKRRRINIKRRKEDQKNTRTQRKGMEEKVKKGEGRR